ncbi:MAG TPA: BatA domain-containing protein [Mucilaginibacter sp.]|nr:BatA domain-containing protein [Mucilaginibacter sp.]
MHFLYPDFLFALITLAIPILIHLFNFRKYQKVYFSNVQFLKDVHEQQSHRNNLKERLILLARILALTFLIFAFSRPYIPKNQSSGAGRQHAVSVFVDNSYSMQTLNREGTLLDEAKRRAKEIASAYGINDRFQLLTQDFEGKHQRLLSRDEFNDAVDAVKPSPQSRSFQQIISRQTSLLDMNKSDIRSIYLISDFQKNMYQGGSVKPDSNVRLTLVRVKANILPNVAIDSVALLSAVHRPGDNERLVVRLHNYAEKTAEKIPLKLEVNGEQKALGSFTIDAGNVQYDTLSFSGLKAGWQRAEITLQDNPVTFDNRFYFSFKVTPQMPVLVINGGTPNKYLNALFASDPFFLPVNTAEGNVNYAALNTYSLIVLSDLDVVSAGLSQQLKSYVSGGGTLLVFPSARADLSSYHSFLQSVNAAFPEKLITDDITVSSINLQNPVFKNVFEHFPQHPDLPTIKKYYPLNISAAHNTENLMMLPGNKVFWAAYRYGKGKTYVDAVPLDTDFSNLPDHALFVPVVFRIALLSGHFQPLFYTLGDDESISIPPVETNEKQLLKLVKDKEAIIPDSKVEDGNTIIYIAEQVKEPGIYGLKKADSTVAEIAFNDNRSESALNYLNDAQLAIAIPQTIEIIDSGKASLKSKITETNFGLQLWKLCIILALICIGAEILLIRFYKTAGIGGAKLPD